MKVISTTKIITINNKIIKKLIMKFLLIRKYYGTYTK